MLNEFILPDLVNLEKLNFIFIRFCYDFHNYLNTDYEISGVYGNFPFCIWNGETANFSDLLILNNKIEELCLQYTQLHVSIYLNCTNTELSNDMLEDTYSNMILNNIERIDASNHIVVNSPLLKEYIKKIYPNALIDIGKYNNIDTRIDLSTILDKYCNLFINPKLNNNFDLLKTLSNKSQLIFTLNPSTCINNCNVYDECLFKEHLSQIMYDPRKIRSNLCENWINNVKLTNIQQTNLYISPQDINKYNNLGFNHFLLESYGNIDDTLSEYINFLIKPEFQNETYNIINEQLQKDLY